MLLGLNQKKHLKEDDQRWVGLILKSNRMIKESKWKNFIWLIFPSIYPRYSGQAMESGRRQAEERLREREEPWWYVRWYVRCNQQMLRMIIPWCWCLIGFDKLIVRKLTWWNHGRRVLEDETNILVWMIKGVFSCCKSWYCPYLFGIQDEMFRQIMGVHQGTVDSYLEENRTVG